MIPASALLPASDRVQPGGTLWHGEAVLGAVMHVEWQWSLFETLARGRYTVSWRMTGGDTDLAGLAEPGAHALRMVGVSGQADDTLLSVVAPDLPFRCHFLAQVDLRDLRVGGDGQHADGTLRTTPVHCAAAAMASAALDLPALRGQVSGDHGALVTATAQQHLAELRLSPGGALSAWPTPALIAQAPMLAGKRYDTTLIW